MRAGNKPTVSIASLDGIDFCVMENIRHLYSKLGASCIIGRRAMPADVLVLVRGTTAEINCDGYQQVHVYNYVGHDLSNMVLRNCSEVVFIEGDASLAKLRPRIGDAEVCTITGRHPVYPELWAVAPRDIAYGVTHIGNRKYEETKRRHDVIQRSLEQAILRTGAIVWGHGWETLLKPFQRKGLAPLTRVPALFSQTSVTLGIRYSYQRQHQLISSRFWLAPLCGCPVLSEEPVLYESIPGVVFAPYATAAEIRDSTNYSERQILASESAAFWRLKTAVIEESLEHQMASLRPREFSPWYRAMCEVTYRTERIAAVNLPSLTSRMRQFVRMLRYSDLPR